VAGLIENNANSARFAIEGGTNLGKNIQGVVLELNKVMCFRNRVNITFRQNNW
jgi:hypothetical protein